MASPRLVLVEDDESDAQLAKIALQHSGVAADMTVYEDGQLAVDKLIAAGEAPALVLLDLNLPKLDGKGVLRRLRAHAPTALTPVVVMSSSDRDQDIRDCYELGANGYVQKALGFEDYSRTVTFLYKFWLTANLRPRPTP